ncbi:MAG: orotidine-5'-phosphate decarboxylase [Thermoanaerobaculia bacterium]
MQESDRLAVAVDLTSRDEILRLVDELRGVVGIFKIGLQAFIANGPALVSEIVQGGERVFLDLKIHDIPNTAKNAIREAAGVGCFMTTVHASGGDAMLRACNDERLLVLGVTVLTSLDAGELHGIGFQGEPLPNAVRLARLTRDAGLRGVVASPLEIAAIREACGPDFTIVTPGIRPAGADAADQRRTLTPREAIAAGADYLVVGRPITDARDRRAAAEAIVEDIARA